ncbi:hypothetical protein RR46_05102 [Papilio xuthus]|uniref:Uncharacterized protein n=1 Tax=Papilio xuthus TaxID=66420 RepID=A0A194Q8P1_PAPXU|nr:hypothetical protein RR46_05102 [Papilio xuthus]
MFVRFQDYVCVVLCVLIISSGTASVLKEVLEDHLKDISHDEGVESLKHDKEKGEKNHQIESQINDSQISQYAKAADDSKYLKKEHDSKKSTDNDAYAGYNSKQDKAEDNETTGFKRGHKKGHHKQGFQNSYHKDESSNKSTYYDDFNDENDQSSYNSRLNTNDNEGRRSYKGGHNNGQEYSLDNYNSRGHNNYKNNGNKQIEHQDYAKKHYLDDHENYNKHRNNHGTHRRDNIRNRHEYHVPHNQKAGWNSQSWDDRNQWERPKWDRNQGWNADYRDPGYDDRGFGYDNGYGYGSNYGYGFDESQTQPVAHIPSDLPVVAERKQIITIYEDPRYDGSSQGQLRREEGDYLHLDIQPSHRRYASYDNSYYTPRRERAMETSRINRLVYNYKQH